MSILGDRTHLAGFVGRQTKNNALLLHVKDDQGADLFEVKQKGSAGVLFGFKNGGAGTYVVKAPGGELAVEIGKVTSCAMGTIEHSAGHGIVKSKDGTVLATIGGHTGEKRDDPWVHALTDAAGTSLGSISRLASTPTRHAESDLVEWFWQLEFPQYTSLKIPSFGVFLELDHPVDAALGDLLVAACVDTALAPRGYRAVPTG
jgi:hypothetical protein